MRALVLLSVLTLASPAMAGPTSGSELSGSMNTLWLYADPDGVWMSNSPEDGTDRYSGYGMGSPWAAPPDLGSFQFDFPLEPAPSAAVRLDTSQPAKVTLFVGSPDFSDPTGIVTGPGAGYIGVWLTVTVDGEVLLDGALQDSGFVGSLAEFTWELTPMLDTVPAGAEVLLSVFIDGGGTSAYIGTAEDWGWSNIVLPVVGGEPAAPPEADEGRAPDPPEEPSNATSTPSPTPVPTTEAAPSNDTVDVQEQDAQGAPGLAAAVSGLMLLAAVAVVRRLR